MFYISVTLILGGVDCSQESEGHQLHSKILTAVTPPWNQKLDYIDRSKNCSTPRSLWHSEISVCSTGFATSGSWYKAAGAILAYQDHKHICVASVTRGHCKKLV